MQAACPRCRARSGAGVTRCLLVATFVLALAATCSASRVGSASRILRTALPSRRAALVSLAVSQGVPNDAPRAAGEGPRATAADINALTTELNDAIQREDFAAAARFRDQIAACAGQAATLDGWIQLGAPEWLAERAERLGFRVPTPVQRRAFRTLTASDTVIRSQTGSGKTLSYLMPILSALSDDLLEEDMTSYLSTYLGGGADEGASTERDARARSLAGRDAVSRNDREQQRNGPLLVIVVATRELGVQVAMLAYQLCGGNRNPIIQPFAHPRRFEPGSLTNMFKWAAPRRAAHRLPLSSACSCALSPHPTARAHHPCAQVHGPTARQDRRRVGPRVAQRINAGLRLWLRLAARLPHRRRHARVPGGGRAEGSPAAARGALYGC